MLDRESEEHWRAIKESYPGAIVFHEAEGLFVVRGRDIEVIAQEFGVRSSGATVGCGSTAARRRSRDSSAGSTTATGARSGSTESSTSTRSATGMRLTGS